jgi:hypothetical protein
MVIINENAHIEFLFETGNKWRIPKNYCVYRHQDEDYIRIITPIGRIFIFDPLYVTLIDDNVNSVDTTNPSTLAAIATALERDNFLFN